MNKVKVVVESFNVIVLESLHGNKTKHTQERLTDSNTENG